MNTNELTIYYSVENHGDGSAHPKFFDTKKLAEWHQDHLYEGWGESCTGSLVVRGNNLVCEKLQSAIGYYLRLLLEGCVDDSEANEFKEEFFSNGLPELVVEIVDNNYYGIFSNGRLVYKKFAYPEKRTNKNGIKRIMETINE